MITSCSPGWVNYAEYFYGDLLGHLSSCKSPHEMEGAIIKSYFAEKKGLDPKNIFVVSIMPCTAKKYEKERPENASKEGLKDVDCVLTTRELARLIKGTLAYVNLIPYNPVNENGYQRSNNVHAFLDRLTKNGVTATIRKEFGTDIDAACGQLRAKHQNNE